MASMRSRWPGAYWGNDVGHRLTRTSDGAPVIAIVCSRSVEEAADEVGVVERQRAVVAPPTGRGPHHGGAVGGVGCEVGPLGARPRAGRERGALDPRDEEAAPIQRPTQVVEREGEDDDGDGRVVDAGQQASPPRPRRAAGRAGRPWPPPASASTTPSASMLGAVAHLDTPAVAVRLDRERPARPVRTSAGGQPGDHGARPAGPCRRPVTRTRAARRRGPAAVRARQASTRLAWSVSRAAASSCGTTAARLSDRVSPALMPRDQRVDEPLEHLVAEPPRRWPRRRSRRSASGRGRRGRDPRGPGRCRPGTRGRWPRARRGRSAPP